MNTSAHGWQDIVGQGGGKPAKLHAGKWSAPAITTMVLPVDSLLHAVEVQAKTLGSLDGVFKGIGFHNHGGSESSCLVEEKKSVCGSLDEGEEHQEASSFGSSNTGALQLGLASASTIAAKTSTPFAGYCSTNPCCQAQRGQTRISREAVSNCRGVVVSEAISGVQRTNL